MLRQNNLLPRPAGSTIPDAAQDPGDPFAARAHCWLVFNLVSTRMPRSFCKAAFQLVGPQHVLVHGVILLQVQNSAFHFAELHKVPVGPFLQPVHVPLKEQHSHLVYQLLPAVLCASSLRVHSVPSARSIIKMLISIGSKRILQSLLIAGQKAQSRVSMMWGKGDRTD